MKVPLRAPVNALIISLLTLSLIGSVAAAPKSPKEKKKPEADPVTWGVLGAAEGCVIFKESHKTNTRFYGVVATWKTYGVHDAIETERYEMAQKHWTEDQDGMNQLQRLATSERLTFVKIEDGYSPALLDKARMICAGALRPNDDSGDGAASNVERR